MLSKNRRENKTLKREVFPKDLPRYCSNINPIEQEWRSFKKEIHNKIIMLKEKLASAVTDGIAAISTPKGLLSKYFPIIFGQN
jgi:hypothetical protein